MINVPLTAIMLVVTVVMAAASSALNYRRRTVFRENRERMAGINAAVQDSLGGIRVVKSFGGEEAERRKFAGANRAFLDTKKRSYWFLGAFHAMNSLFVGVLYTVTVVGGGFFVAQGTLGVQDLAIYALYIGIFAAPVEQLVNFAETLQKGYAGFRRFVEVLAERPDVVDRPGAVALGVAEAAREGEESAAGRAAGSSQQPGLAAGAEGAREADAQAAGQGLVRAIATCGSPTMATCRCCAGSTCVYQRAARWRWWGPRARARPPRARCCRGSMTWMRARWRSTASTCAT